MMTCARCTNRVRFPVPGLIGVVVQIRVRVAGSNPPASHQLNAFRVAHLRPRINILAQNQRGSDS